MTLISTSDPVKHPTSAAEILRLTARPAYRRPDTIMSTESTDSSIGRRRRRPAGHQRDPAFQRPMPRRLNLETLRALSEARHFKGRCQGDYTSRCKGLPQGLKTLSGYHSFSSMSGSSFTGALRLNTPMMCIIRKAAILLSQLENISQKLAALCSVCICIHLPELIIGHPSHTFQLSVLLFL